MEKSYADKPIIALLVATIIAAWCLWQFAAVWSVTMDDAYISLRYALHWSQGHGLQWNIGMPAVEGYSNFFYVVIAMLAHYFGLNAVLSLKIVSGFGWLLTLYSLYTMTRMRLSPLLSLVPPFAFSLYYGTIWWSVTGLETIFYVGLLSLLLLFILQQLQTSPSLQKAYCIGFIGFLLSLTRPEAPVVWITLMLGMCVILRQQFVKWRLFFIISNLCFLIPYGAYFTWRIATFGRWLPNSVYCKSFHADNPWALLIAYIPLAFPLLIACIETHRLKVRGWWLLLIPSTVYTIILYGADPIIGEMNRHFLAAYAVLLVASIWGISAFMQRWQLPNLAQVILLILFCFLTIPTQPRRTLHNIALQYQARTQLRQQVATWLNQHSQANDWVAVSDCGVIPYYTRTHVIDTLCLNSYEMTRPPISRSQSRMAQWVLNQKKPKFIVIAHYQQKMQYEPFYQAIQNDRALKSTFNTHYLLAIKLKSTHQSTDLTYQIFKKKSA